MFPGKNSVIQDPQLDERLLKMAEVIDEFEGYAHPHAARLAALADAAAVKFGLAPKDRSFIRQAALIHDIGEVMMNREYIKSSRSLTEAERFDLMRHPVIGEQEAAKRGLGRAVQLLIRWHHEWWNGSGYPDTVGGHDIPLGARILRVVDTYCALTDDRPYSTALSAKEAKAYLEQWAGIEFDPEVVRIFLTLSDIPELGSFAAAPVPEQPDRAQAALYQE